MNREVDELVLNLGLCLEHSDADVTKKLQALSLLMVAFSQRAEDGETDAVRYARIAVGNAAARLISVELGDRSFSNTVNEVNHEQGD